MEGRRNIDVIKTPSILKLTSESKRHILTKFHRARPYMSNAFLTQVEIDTSRPPAPARTKREADGGEL
jgi:hypothetical protein